MFSLFIPKLYIPSTYYKHWLYILAVTIDCRCLAYFDSKKVHFKGQNWPFITLMLINWFLANTKMYINFDFVLFYPWKPPSKSRILQQNCRHFQYYPDDQICRTTAKVQKFFCVFIACTYLANITLHSFIVLVSY